MRVCISGTHGVGKTTLFKELKEDPVFETFTFLSEGARDSLGRGYEFGTEHLQLDCFFRHIINENSSAGMFISDRGVIDCLSYIRAFKMFDNGIIKLMEEVSVLKVRYDLVLYIPIENKLEMDGVRFSKHRKNVDDMIRDYSKVFCEKTNFIIKGTPEERLSLAQDIIFNEMKNYGRFGAREEFA